MRLLLFLLLIVLTSSAPAQSLDGTYLGTEPRRHALNDDGEVIFYPPSLYPWYFEVRVLIRGERIDLFKRYVYQDSLSRKYYADSLTNTYHFVAKLTKAEDRYVARSFLANKPAGYIYINGQYTKEANIFYDPGVLKTLKADQNLYRSFTFSDGTFHVAREQIEQDLVIKPDSNGIWINNKFYKKTHQASANAQ